MDSRTDGDNDNDDKNTATTIHLGLDVRIQIVSDLHIEFFQTLERIPDDIIVPRAPVLALLGDIGLAGTELLRSFLHQQADRFEHVLFLAGNHEFYNHGNSKPYSVDEQLAWMRQVCQERDNLHFLEKQAVEIGGVLILGTTLWSHVPLVAADDAERFMNDYNICFVRDEHGNVRRMTTTDTNQWHADSVKWLEQQIDQAALASSHQPVVVLTHHTPSLEGTSHPQYEGSTLSSCFSTDLKKRLMRHPVQVWACGHTHYNFDHLYHVEPSSPASATISKGVRLVSNQRGYEGKENTDYDKEGIVIRVSPEK